jgi:hypothetical protein
LFVITTNILLFLILFVGTISTVAVLLLLLLLTANIVRALIILETMILLRDADHRRFEGHSERGHDRFRCKDAVNYKKQHEEEIC